MDTVVVVPETHTATAMAASGLTGALGGGLVLSGPDPSAGVREAVAATGTGRVIVLSDDEALVEAWATEGYEIETIASPGGPPAVAATMARRIAEATGQSPSTAFLVGVAALADAVAVGPWAHEVGAPVLLTAAGALDPHTAFVVDQLEIDRVVIIGGPAAVSEQVAEALRSRGVVVERVAGAERTATAFAVAAGRGVDLDDVVVVASADPVDAAASAPWAARGGFAVVPDGEPLADALAARCGAGAVIRVAGGTAAVSADQEARLRRAAERCDGAGAPLALRVGVAAPGRPQAAGEVAAVLGDPHGWSSRRVVVTGVGEDHTMGLLILGNPCGGAVMCRHGRDVLLDADHWARLGPATRTRLVNLAIGHRLGEPLGETCQGRVMDPLDCGAAPSWPTEQERGRVADRFVPTATVALAGDVHAERHIGTNVRNGGNPLDHVADVLASADLAVLNLETPLSTRGAPVPKTYTFRGPPEMADRLVDAGVDVVSLANNHGLDYGPVAMLDTLEHASAAGLPVVGAGANQTAAYAPSLHETPAGTIAVVGLTRVLHTRAWEATASRPGMASGYDEAAAVAAVRAAAERADHVVVAIHWGTELGDCPDANQRRLAVLLADAGADVIAGHHPHVLQGVQDLGGTVVVYSLGNFVWYHNRAPSRFTGVLTVELPLLDAPAWSLDPAEIGTDGRPRFVDGAAGEAIRSRMLDRSPGGAVGCGFPTRD